MTETITLLTRPDAAKYLRISLRTLYQFLADGEIQKVQYRPGGRVFLDKADLDEFIEKSKRRG
ncbi:MAG: helix-turn-helix domain-containing protein [Candidatus Omnitrophota bacterium]